jgi:hypothetical protein
MKQATKPFALCIENTGNEASLMLGKVYRILPDPRATKDDLVRIIDESVSCQTKQNRCQKKASPLGEASFFSMRKFPS